MPRGRFMFRKAISGSAALRRTLFGEPEPWRPDELGAGLALWLDADDASTITLNGSTVVQWNDKSGNGLNVSQATTANQPTYSATGMVDKPTLDWGANVASTKSLTRAISGYAPQRYFGVGEWDGTDPFNFFCGLVTHGPLFGISAADRIMTNNNGQAWLGNLQYHLNGGAASSAALPTISNSFVFATTFGPQVGRTILHIGNDADLGSQSRQWRGKISEIIAINFVPTTQERQLIEGYLAWKWGLTYALPNGHPYKWETSLFGGTNQDGFDADAKTYITAVETADGQDLEPIARAAINDFVVGCKADGIWTAIKASCILAGARTLTGALVPLKGTAPTNFNFVDGDYSRTTGLVGDGSTKYLDSNRNNNADPQDSFHLSVYASSASQIATNNLIGARLTGDNESARTIFLASTPAVRSLANFNGVITVASAFSTGFVGVRRATSTSATLRFAAINTDSTLASTSVAANSLNTSVFARRTGAGTLDIYSDARLAFYSIGESLDLALLDARVTTLINAYGAI